jgi:phosphoribosylaminoimidazole-succinocarboxamide synthase
MRRNSMKIVTKTALPFTLFKKGKVRDIYELKENLLLIATDRISAFDYVLPNPIPYKGVCLTQLSLFWFDFFKNTVPNHFVTADVSRYPSEAHDYREVLEGRSMLIHYAKVLPIECIVRGYISGSAWKSYKKNGTVCGLKLPSGLQQSDQLEEPLFTPSTKAETGHDINISYEEMMNTIGKGYAKQLRDYSLKLYKQGSEYARKKGIIIADTKFEFGVINGTIHLIDEVLTPDSSRFWPADSYEPGKPQTSFDKQYLRDYLSNTGWDKNSPPPQLPEDVVKETQRKYFEAYELLSGKRLMVDVNL